MKKVIALLIICVLVLSCDNQGKKEAKEVVTTYYFIRHAEKDLSDPTNRNPDLTKKGEERAEAWKTYLLDKNIEAVYSTDYIRTMRTAEPIANKLNLEIIKYNPSSLYDDAFAKATQGKNVVVVGHSNTTPNFANAILKSDEAPEIDESDYSNVYIVTVKGDKATFQGKRIEE